MSQFESIEKVATHLREELESKKTILLFAYNGTGKTRLSMAFKELGKQVLSEDEYENLAEPRPHIVNEFPVNTKDGDHIDVVQLADTLYFNAFTEDLFGWDNDLNSDSERMLRLNSDSKFFAGLEELEMDNRIRPFLNRYADFDFRIDTDNWVVRFSREVHTEDTSETFDDIKVSRGEENLFIWCFFLAVLELAMDKGIEAYSWVKYIYIDDPISSLDENNAVAVGHHLAQLLKDKENPLKNVISTHHTLFFNVLCNEFHRVKGAKKYFLSRNKVAETYTLKDEGDTPFFYHVAMLAELNKAAKSGELYTYHFNMLRIILEKTASFHGYKGFADCIKKDEGDVDGVMHARLINILNHGNYSLYEPKEMLQENKDIFKQIFNNFLQNYNFNTASFTELIET